MCKDVKTHLYMHPVLKEILNDNKDLRISRLFIKDESIKFIITLAKLYDVKNVLELGTCVGYSSIWLASNLKNTKITSIEHNENYFLKANEYLKKTKLKNLVLINDDINNYLKSIKDNFLDLIIQDSKKAMYPSFIDETIRITKNDGLIIADDTLLSKKGYPYRITKPINEYNKLVSNNSKLKTNLINIGNGLTVSIVIK